jgi:hypothetical protein
MEAVVEQRELFPVIDKKAPHRGFLWRYIQATVDRGALVPVSYAGEALDVSRQRVYQLIDSGQLPVVEIGDRKFIAARDLEEFLKLDRKTGYNVNRRWIYLGDGQPLKKR